jgi:hypothetical protein
MIAFGVVSLAGGLLGKEFYYADIVTLAQGKRRSSTWSGRLVFIVVGVGLIAVGLKFLIDSR